MYYVSVQDSVRQYDRFKTIVVMLLVAVLLPLLWFGRDTARGSAAAGEGTATETAPPQQVAAPAPPVTLDTPADGTTFVTDSATLIGTATPGDRVFVLVNGTSAGEVPVAVDGGWRYDLAMPEPGDYRIVARLVGTGGVEKGLSHAIIVSRLPSLKPISTPAIAEPQADATVAAGELEFTGTGEPAREVVLVVDGKELGRSTAAPDGRWTLKATLAAGGHDAHAYTLDDAGNALMSNTVHLSVSGEAPVAASAQGAEGDGDGDRVADGVDQCPGTPAGVAVDEHGCPRAGETLLTLTGVTFENNKAELKPESAEVLDRAIETLKRSPGLGIVIEGHTDDRGDADYNLELSRQRAESVRQYFIDHGLPQERLEAVGKGETEPLIPNDNEEARRKNRRVELVVK
ncbi:MAG: hypothetical protein HONDAALG_03805 [Gammaproteobacteria bacterium]|nr:hypothetical protein [Gammaproteobacteria bacterium]